MLDENLPAAQQLWLRKWRIHFRVVGVDVATWGTPDENLLPVLRRLAWPTFISLDRHFYRADWRACLAYAADREQHTMIALTPHEAAVRP